MSEHLKHLRQLIKRGDLEQSLLCNLKNHPLLHFSDAADTIMAEGFQFGEPRAHALDHTTHASRSSRGILQPGYNFAFNATGFDELNSCHDYEVATPQCERSLEGMCAKKALLFFADGLYTQHYDDFLQVIFWGPAANMKNAVLFENVAADEDDGDEYGHWIARTADGSPIAAAQERLKLRDCVAKVLLHLESSRALSKSAREAFRWCYAEHLGQPAPATAA